MSRCFRYSASRKVEAVRRVVEDGRRVCEVADELGVSEGSLFFWVRRYREFALRLHQRTAAILPAASHSLPEPATSELGSLVAWLRHAEAPQTAKSGKAARRGPQLASNR